MIALQILASCGAVFALGFGLSWTVMKALGDGP